MANLFKQHRETVISNNNTIEPEVEKTHDIGTNELLSADIARIKKTEQSQRDALKGKLIVKYQEPFDSACEEISWADSRLIFWNIIWRFDVGDIVGAFAIAKVAIERNLNADAKVFRSTFKTIVADNIFNWAKAQYDSEATAEPVLSEMIALLENGLDINLVANAKLLKLQGDIIKADNPTLALQYFTKAQGFDKTIGVKTRIEELNKILSK